MIADKLSTIFIHIPKTAGRSIVYSFINNLTGKSGKGGLWSLPDETKEQFGLVRDLKHRTAAEYKADEPGKFETYYKFAIVRNPWERMVSEFHWRNTNRYKSFYSSFTEFVSFVQTTMQTTDPSALPMLERDVWIHNLPQHKYVLDENDSLIINEVFMFARLEDCIRQLNERLNITLTLESHNKTNHNHYSTFYNDKTKQIIETLYAKDIELFNFQYEGNT